MEVGRFHLVRRPRKRSRRGFHVSGSRASDEGRIQRLGERERARAGIQYAGWQRRSSSTVDICPNMRLMDRESRDGHWASLSLHSDSFFLLLYAGCLRHFIVTGTCPGDWPNAAASSCSASHRHLMLPWSLVRSGESFLFASHIALGLRRRGPPGPLTT